MKISCDQQLYFPVDESVTLHATATETYVRLQEPDFGNSTVAATVCATAQASQPLRRLVTFDFRWNNISTASFYNDDYDRIPDTKDFSLPVLEPFTLNPGATSLNRCFNITIHGDDNVEIINELLVIVLRPVSPLDRVNFTANNTITIIIEDNLSE